MNITLIGTGAIYSQYNNACTLINDDMLIDVPNGILKTLLRNNHIPEKIDKILITHLHGDHTADIPFLLMYIAKNYILLFHVHLYGHCLYLNNILLAPLYFGCNDRDF